MQYVSPTILVHSSSAPSTLGSPFTVMMGLVPGPISEMLALSTLRWIHSMANSHYRWHRRPLHASPAAGSRPGGSEVPDAPLDNAPEKEDREETNGATQTPEMRHSTSTKLKPRQRCEQNEGDPFSCLLRLYHWIFAHTVVALR